MSLFYQRLDLDGAKFIGTSPTVTHVWYTGHQNLFDEFCKYCISHFPFIKALKVYNIGISTIPDSLVHRLEIIDCSYTDVKKLKYGPELKVLIAPGTGIELYDVLQRNPSLKYLKLGSIEDGSRITIDSEAEYSDFCDHYLRNFSAK
jgi:hypothetical protein